MNRDSKHKLAVLTASTRWWNGLNDETRNAHRQENARQFESAVNTSKYWARIFPLATARLVPRYFKVGNVAPMMGRNLEGKTLRLSSPDTVLGQLSFYQEGDSGSLVFLDATSVTEVFDRLAIESK